MRRFSNNKDINKFIKNLMRERKWYCLRGKKHPYLYSSKGKRITVPSTPSDYRAYQNFKKDITRVILNEAI
jgi:hypothetical protein